MFCGLPSIADFRRRRRRAQELGCAVFAARRRRARMTWIGSSLKKISALVIPLRTGAEGGPAAAARQNEKPARRGPAGAARRIAFRQVGVSRNRVKRGFRRRSGTPAQGEARPLLGGLNSDVRACSESGGTAASAALRICASSDIAFIHSITSSARNKIAVGSVRPSIPAVLRLTISSTFTACCTGRSAGFSPLRMRPV